MALITDPDDAVRSIADGACVGVGGSINAGHPMALVRALIRSGASDLTVVGLTSGLDLDLLVAGGGVSTLSAAYVGAEGFAGLPPAIRWGAEEGWLDVWESEEGIHLASLRARALKLPYTTWTAIGTAPTSHPLVEESVDSSSGVTYLKVRPLKVDAALFWAEAADEDGNLLLWGPDFGDEALRNAADLRVAQVDRIVPTSVLTKHPDRVLPWAADVVVHAPLSTHPFSSAALRVDDRWITAYCDAVLAARRAGDRQQLADFVAGWITGLPDEDAYLARVGVARLRELLT